MTTLCDEFESLQLSLCGLLVSNAEKINRNGATQPGYRIYFNYVLQLSCAVPCLTTKQCNTHDLIIA